MASILDDIIKDCSSSSSRQEALGSFDCVDVIFSFFSDISPPAYLQLELEDQSSQISSDRLSAEHILLETKSSESLSVFEGLRTIGQNNEAKLQQQKLIEKCLRTLVHLCRREIDKATSNIVNISTIENYPQSYAIIKRIANAHMKYLGIAYAVSYLVMIMASDSAERQFKLTAVGFSLLIVTIMGEHKGDNSVAEMACRAARNLAAGDDDIVAKLVEDGVCAGLVGIIRSQISSQEIEKQIVDDEYKDSNLISIESYQENGFKVDSAVCEAALWAVVNLACDENVATILGSVGGIGAVIDLAEKCQENENLALPSVSAIRNLSSAGTLNYSLLAHTRVCEVLLFVLIKYGRDVEIAETGLWAITNLACDSVLGERLGLLGAGKVITDLYYSIVPLHPSEGRPAGPISEACLWAITNLAGGSIANEDRLGLAGACGLVGQALYDYSHREGMLEICLNALIHMVFHSEANKLRIGGFNPCEIGVDGGEVTGGGVKEGAMGVHVKQSVNNGSKIFSTTCDSILKFKDNENIAENILKLFLLSINTPSSSNHSKPILLALNILPLTVEIISAHPNNPEIIRLGCGFLLVLKYDNSTYRESLVRANQLNEQGKAAPKGIRLLYIIVIIITYMGIY
jgi:hypothetical protein